MQLVYIPGVWDLLHVGHVEILERARALGDRLVVGVPSDEVVEEDKQVRPTICLLDRMSMLKALKCVDVVIAYYKLDFIGHLRMIRPDILAVGETWGDEVRHRRAESWTKENNCRIVQLPYSNRESTTLIKQRIRQS